MPPPTSNHVRITDTTTFWPSTDATIAFDPYTYTHGTWLHRNNERQAARKLQFNFDALLCLAIDRSPGATRVLSCDKKEGGFNRVFVIWLDNGKSVIARLPTKLAGPPRITVSSEVATLQFGMCCSTFNLRQLTVLHSQSRNPRRYQFPMCWHGVHKAMIQLVLNTSS
jgi:hypothetical protein